MELADNDEDEAEALKRLEDDDQRKEDIKRIRIKALMRRARARSEQGGWGDLQGALEGKMSIVHDYSFLSFLLPWNQPPTNPLFSFPNRLPTPLLPLLLLFPPPAFRHPHHQHRSPHPPTAHRNRQEQRNGRDDGQTQGSWQRHPQTLWLVDGQFQV